MNQKAAVFEFHQNVLDWYENHGRKHLPWQQHKTFYSVWISEIMLQQTQVKTVIPYYEKFLHRFPNIQALAAADLDEVLALWSGLGYYARARNLHRAAQKIESELKGAFPPSIETLTQLPGVGRSTAGAILSLTLNQPYPILDGNVKRVLARFFCESNEKKLWTHAEALIRPDQAAAYTQAMMDIGSSICTRSKPKCSLCPLSKECQARLTQKIEQFPAKSILKMKENQHSYMLLFQQKNSFLLEHRENTGLWGGLWTFPLLERSPENLEKIFSSAWGEVQVLAEKVHIFSHFELHYSPVLISTTWTHLPKLDPWISSARETQWFEIQEALHLGIPRPIQELLLMLKKQNEKRS